MSKIAKIYGSPKMAYLLMMATKSVFIVGSYGITGAAIYAAQSIVNRIK